MRALLVVGVVLMAWVGVAWANSNVRLVDNGYEGVVVAISPSVQEARAPEIISSIKTTLTEASTLLYKATHSRAFFKNVKILLPDTWTSTPTDGPALNENFEDSNIRVDVPNPVYGHQPYTDQPGGCGDPGRYIHLTPDYLTDDSQVQWWGPRDKVLVHEWAKLRWGVFDEIGYPNDPKYPLFYPEIEIGGFPLYVPNYCANGVITGELRDLISGDYCHIIDNDDSDVNCRFNPDADQTTSSSLMSYYYINSVEKFCDSSSELSHKSFAPNKHNDKCNERSVWDVISDHPDFSNGRNPPSSTPAAPVFRVVGQESAKFALVLDYSGSMWSHSRINKLQRTAQRWILHEVDDGSSVGIIRFSSSATKVHRLTEISNSTRQSLANSISTNANGMTCIGCGLSMAINDVLKDQMNSVILLITDGGENQRPYISDIMNAVVASGVRVVTIAFGRYADVKLESLAKNTDGKTYFVLDEDDGGMLDDAFQGALTYQPGQTNTNVQIYERDYQGVATIMRESFTVDASVGRNLEYRLDTDSAAHVRSAPYITSPTGVNHTDAVFDSSINMWTIKVPLAEEGEWSWGVTLSGSRSRYIRVRVTAQARDPDSSPIYTRVWMSAGAGGADVTTNPVIIYAEVKQGNRPVVGARVRAQVTQPDNSAPVIELDLRDNGQGADNQAGDGIYSRYFTSYTIAGRYSVKAQVWDEGSAFVNNGFVASRKLPHVGRAMPAKPLETPNFCCGSVVPFDSSLATPTGSFTRSASGGSFQVTVVPPRTDTFPPSRVTDLQVAVTLSSLNLTWTAPGDDFDAGTVSGYEVRMGVNRSHLLTSSFDGDESVILLGMEDSSNMTHLFVEAGQYVNLYLQLEQELEQDTLYYIALRAVDDGNNLSPVSNMVTALVASGKSRPPPPPSPNMNWWNKFFFAEVVV